jgi:hypothetical protein
MTEPTEILQPDEEKPPRNKWFKRAGKDVGVGGSLGAISAIPVAGPILVGIVQEIRTTHARLKAEAALRDVREELSARIDQQDAKMAAKIEAHANSAEYINDVLAPGLEAITRAQGEAKVKAAKNFTVNAAMAAGEDDPALREFVAAFLRDATILDIRTLLEMPASGERVKPQSVGTEVVIPHLDNWFNDLSLGLRLSGPKNEGLLRGALGRLDMLGLCLTQMGTSKRISPIQRTALGDSVAEMIS